MITLTLRKQGNINITVLNENKIYSDRRLGLVLSLYISDVSNTQNVKLIIDDKEYSGKSTDASHYEFSLSDAKKEAYQAAVFDGEDLIGNISFKVTSKTRTINDDFDDFGDDF